MGMIKNIWRDADEESEGFQIHLPCQASVNYIWHKIQE